MNVHKPHVVIFLFPGRELKNLSHHLPRLASCYIFGEPVLLLAN